MAPNSNRVPTFVLKIRFDPTARGKIITDPFTAGPMLEKVEALSRNVGLAGQGAWGPGPVYNLSGWDWLYQVAIVGSSAWEALRTSLLNVDEIARVELEPQEGSGTLATTIGEAHGRMQHIDQFWQGNDAITKVYGVEQPAGPVIPFGFRVW